MMGTVVRAIHVTRSACCCGADFRRFLKLSAEWLFSGQMIRPATRRGTDTRDVLVVASRTMRHATRMQDDFSMIANLSVQHQRRIDDDLEPWDEYAVTAELRTFRVTVVQLQDGGFGTQITETSGRRGA